VTIALAASDRLNFLKSRTGRDFVLRNHPSRAAVIHSVRSLPQDHSRVWPALERGAINGLRHREIVGADDVLQNVIAVCVPHLETKLKMSFGFHAAGDTETVRGRVAKRPGPLSCCGGRPGGLQQRTNMLRASRVGCNW
jgi:hypothetical protein